MERCDRCIARAYCRASRKNKELYFCHYHYRKYEKNLILWARLIVNEHNVILYTIRDGKKINE